MKHLILLIVVVFCGCKVMAQDTVKVIFLYSDTTKIDMNFTPVLVDSNSFNKQSHRFGFVRQHVGFLFWMYGYEIRKDTFVAAHEEHGTNDGFDRMPYTLMVDDETYSILKERLDADKKPLSKSIVVWQTKNLNP